ncbi:12525_t:CDS:1, partial [Funneliformis caledonium]
KRNCRASMIEQLEKSHDQLVNKFSESELFSLKMDNRYHSPEDSETNEDFQTGNRKIVIRDLWWRSSI